MSKEELEDKFNNYKMKLNMVDFKLDSLNAMIENYNQKEENIKRLRHRNIYKLTTILLVGMLSLLTNLWFVPVIIYALSFPFLIKTISCSISLKKIKKFKNYLNSKHFNLAFAKFVFTTNQSKIQNSLNEIEKMEINKDIEEVKNPLFNNSNIDEVDELNL